MTSTESSGEHADVVVAYVASSAELVGIPLTAERQIAVAQTFARIVEFARDVEAFALSDDVEPAGRLRL